MADQQNIQNEGGEMSAKELNALLQVRRDKLNELCEAGQNPYEITKYDQTHHAQEIKDGFDALEGQHVSIAGRMMSKRVMGKASFCNVQDLSGSIQCYVCRDSLGEDEYKGFKRLDIGDLVGIKGTVFKTKTGETSVHAESVTLLSKSLRSFPRSSTA